MCGCIYGVNKSLHSLNTCIPVKHLPNFTLVFLSLWTSTILFCLPPPALIISLIEIGRHYWMIMFLFFHLSKPLSEHKCKSPYSSAESWYMECSSNNCVSKRGHWVYDKSVMTAHKSLSLSCLSPTLHFTLNFYWIVNQPWGQVDICQQREDWTQYVTDYNWNVSPGINKAIQYL